MTATDRQPLTDRQRAVLREIVRHWGERGCSPTVRELCVVCGIRSPNGVAVHLLALAAKGWIRWAPAREGKKSKARGIDVPELLAAAKAAADTYLEGLT